MTSAATLLVDAGNTRVKFGWIRPGHCMREPETLALAHSELNRLPDWLAQLPMVPEACLGVSVAHAAVATAVEESVARETNVAVQWLRSTAQAAGLVNSYDAPEQLGYDRWIALIGLSKHTSAVAVLASFGTATTVDTLGPAPGAPVQLDASGSSATGGRIFEGGLILPGPELMRQSLAAGTAGLPYALGASVAFPRNTHSAISSGIAAAQAGAVVRQWRHALEHLGSAPKLYCTGGGRPLVETEVAAGLLRAQADMGLAEEAPVWLDAPVLDGLAALAAPMTGGCL